MWCSQNVYDDKYGLQAMEKRLQGDNDKRENLSEVYKRCDAESIVPISKMLEEKWNSLVYCIIDK